MGFIQAPPLLNNQYLDDRLLRSLLRRTFAKPLLDALEPSLLEVGEASANEWREQVLRERNLEPSLEHFDAFGNRIDRVRLSPFWDKAPAIASRMGFVAAGYEKNIGALARVYQFALVYLFAPSSEFYVCPLAMTDGAARCLLDSKHQALIERAVPRYLSRDPSSFWISGQWMTETTGGSDVSGTETIARKDEHGRWRLYGRKWFTSAVVADTALVLARPEGQGAGADNLALFYLEPRKPDGKFRNIEIDRLKDKLGTRKLPTAEIRLLGTPAELIGDTKHGVRMMAPMLNITRLWNSIAAISHLRRGLALARDYAARRVVFAHPLIDHPLHQETLADLQVELEASFHLTFYVAELLGKVEHQQSDDTTAHLLRLLTPITKLMTAKQAVSGLTEIIESFGGVGYVEDSGLPTLLRDAHVFPIWEGTTNVLALDVIRVLNQIGGATTWLTAIRSLLAQATHESLQPSVKLVRDSATAVTDFLRIHSTSRESLAAGARSISLTLGRTMALALLLRHADWSLRAENDPRPAAAARRFARHGVNRLRNPLDPESKMLASDIFA